MFLGFSLLFIFLKEKKNIKLGGEGGNEELGGGNMIKIYCMKKMFTIKKIKACFQ